ncbi:MAG: hypothetical protein V9G24_03690 [Rhodoblastus sp.]
MSFVAGDVIFAHEFGIAPPFRHGDAGVVEDLLARHAGLVTKLHEFDDHRGLMFSRLSRLSFPRKRESSPRLSARALDSRSLRRAKRRE